eukprot:1159715-Pelagomonas_calceolata.AAC.4
MDSLASTANHTLQGESSAGSEECQGTEAQREKKIMLFTLAQSFLNKGLHALLLHIVCILSDEDACLTLLPGAYLYIGFGILLNSKRDKTVPSLTILLGSKGAPVRDVCVRSAVVRNAGVRSADVKSAGVRRRRRKQGAEIELGIGG